MTRENRTFTWFFVIALFAFALAAHAKHESHPTAALARS